MRPCREGFFGGRRFWRLAKPLRMINQQARKHRAGALFDPLVNEHANFLAEIGGVSEPRELVALQRIARSRKKEFPWGLRWGTGHVDLLETRCAYGNKEVIHVYGTDLVPSVEICGKVRGRDLTPANRPPVPGEGETWAAGPGSGLMAIRACSACAGDYEDPDRTAWPLEETADRGENEGATAEDKFPDG